MAKLSKKTVDNVFNDFKDSLFISDALEKNSVRPFDFFEYLKNNESANKEYENIEKFNNIFKEAQIEKKVYTGDFSKTILLEMIRVKDKKKYVQKIEIEDTTPLSSLTDEEVNQKIKDLQDKLGLT